MDKKLKKKKTMILLKETIRTVAGAGWHRGTTRCYETWNYHCVTDQYYPGCETMAAATCVTDCGCGSQYCW